MTPKQFENYVKKFDKDIILSFNSVLLAIKAEPIIHDAHKKELIRSMSIQLIEHL